MATPPKIVTPGRSVFLTIRAVNRQYRFAPDEQVVQSIRYIFWHCAAAYNMSIHEVTWMSNHAHICLTDNDGVLPRFVCQMNSLISRQLNALRGLKGSNIEKGYSDIEVCHDDSMVSLCAYTLANPCAAHLVRHAKQWKGFTSYSLEYGESFVIVRPSCGMWKEGSTDSSAIPKGFRPKFNKRTKGDHGDTTQAPPKRKKPSRLPLQVTGQLVRPAIRPDLSDEVLRGRIRQETEGREHMAQQQREQEGRQVLGMAAVRKKRWNEYPSTMERVFDEIPRIATRCISEEIEKRRQISIFRNEHADAMVDYITRGPDAARFPYGTWKMKTLFQACCASGPPGCA